MADSREKALQDYRKKLLEHKEVDGRLKECTAFPPIKAVFFLDAKEMLGVLFNGEADVAV